MHIYLGDALEAERVISSPLWILSMSYGLGAERKKKKAIEESYDVLWGCDPAQYLFCFSVSHCSDLEKGEYLIISKAPLSVVTLYCAASSGALLVTTHFWALTVC